ncbi:F0F1 ATP synthase subunit delta [Agarilytica rhodophyticola]|uniref:F0F1 ATP synthase subunit delta n=1 Tax=Agarilytica rhodophyticola TaxID=1737490 RepID=UPI000B343510|nr:F0F1 ATP synthase subunit delta [Agarilytica rhodophyticola]
MAELITLARPYAKAAFEYARAAKDLQGWQTALAQAASVSMDASVKAMLSSPNLTSTDKGLKFGEVCGDVLNQQQVNFINVLAVNNRLGLLAQVYELFALYKANQEKTVDVEIQTAFEISSDLEQKLATTLKAKLDRDVELKTTIDESLIGGALIRAGDTVIDGSARGRLAKLAEAMNA